MDSYEAARAVFQRVQALDPDNAHKIVGYILIQDQAEKEMIRLAFGPDNLLHSVISTAKSELGLSSNTSSASAPLPFSLSSPRFSPVGGSPSSPWSYSAPDGAAGHLHRRSFSVNDIQFGADDFGFKPCLYFSRGFCKNGSSCKFVHGGENPAAVVGSPSKLEAFEQYQQEVARSKLAQQQQRLAAAQFIAGVNSPYNKLNFLQNEAQRTAAATLMMEEEIHKLNRLRFGRNDTSEMGFGDSAPGSRQIYLTFPADSTFKEEDVSNYFSIFGPVQDVRIPYQQKRMFGFVTFVYPETVKIILGKGNPHFVCDSRVLVKPYKEKGKLQDKKQQCQPDRSEFSSCSSPSGLDCREPFEMHVGPRMFYNNPEMLRKKLEQEADWQRALEFQRQRLMNLQLLDLKNHPRYHHDSSLGSPHSDVSLNISVPLSTNVAPDEAVRDNQGSPVATKEQQEENLDNGDKNDDHEIRGSDVHESFEHALPDGLLSSPTKSVDERSIFSVAPPKPCLFEIPGRS